MIQFNNINLEPPYLHLKSKYDEALKAGQTSIEAISISSYNTKNSEVESRYVNIKFIIDCEFIFFSNYESPKAVSFYSHNQIAAIFFWPAINVQIRMKAEIKKTSIAFNQKYFRKRNLEKNALAISSDQSKPIDSFNQVKENYNNSLENDDLKKCPDFWGGYSFTPYYFEFWEGNDFRLNKREVYEKDHVNWNHYLIQP